MSVSPFVETVGTALHCFPRDIKMNIIEHVIKMKRDDRREERARRLHWMAGELIKHCVQICPWGPFFVLTFRLRAKTSFSFTRKKWINDASSRNWVYSTAPGSIDQIIERNKEERRISDKYTQTIFETEYLAQLALHESRTKKAETDTSVWGRESSNKMEEVD